MAEINLLADIIAREAQAIDYNNANAEAIAAGVANAAITMTEDEFCQTVLNYISQNTGYDQIVIKIKNFLNKLKEYNLPKKFGGGSLEERIKWLELKKDLIYKDFFELQNLINNFLGQEIKMTYVHTDDEGRREIRISENNIDHLMVTRGSSYWGEYAKLTYVVDSGYEKLKNSLPEEDNDTLQDTAREVEYRYEKNKKRVMWYYPDRPENWKGYRFTNKGPINEAYVNLYVHNIKLKYSMEPNIDTFMLDTSYGAIKADATKGFLLGDIANGITQYAVKGAFGSPQGTADVINYFEKMEQSNFTPQSFANFIKHFTYDELHKEYKPQIKEMSKRSIGAVLRYANKKITS